jgi:hypothetical protein
LLAGDLPPPPLPDTAPLPPAPEAHQDMQKRKVRREEETHGEGGGGLTKIEAYL